MPEFNDNSNRGDELLSAYVDGELTDAERAKVEERLASDPAARELVAEMRALSGTLRALPKMTLTEDVRAAVLGQVRDKRVTTLPTARISPLRRLIWPALAIAAALVLMFTQEDRQENREVAGVDVREGEARDRPAAERGELAFEAPATVSAPEASAPPAEEGALVADSQPTILGAPVEGTSDQPRVAGRAIDALTKADAEPHTDAELGIVHLTLTDLRTGTERFDRLLVSNGVQVLDESTDAGRASPMADSTAAQAETLSTRSAGPAGGFGGAASSAPSSVTAPTQPEMVLVEAPPEQIEQILFACNNDTETIEEVSIDPSASGTNLVPEKQRLLGYQQYARGARRDLKLKSYGITPAQQGMIAALNSIQTSEETAEPASAGLQPQGWATKFRTDQQPPELQQLENEVNQRRNQYFDYAQQQRSQALNDRLAKEELSTAPPMRVLFLLHPSTAAK
jgi:anti-sigma factor RsiW